MVADANRKVHKRFSNFKKDASLKLEVMVPSALFEIYDKSPERKVKEISDNLSVEKLSTIKNLHQNEIKSDGYTLFCSETRKQFEKDGLDYLPSVIASIWKSLLPATRNDYEARAMRDISVQLQRLQVPEFHDNSTKSIEALKNNELSIKR